MSEGIDSRPFEPDGYVYVSGNDRWFKIGKAKDVNAHVARVGIQLPWPVELVHYFPCENYSTAEKSLHEQYAHKRRNGEWFRLNQYDVAFLKKIIRMREDEIEYCV